jgi:peptidoglycan/LPS O-acetylase OafA/YrhL
VLDPYRREVTEVSKSGYILIEYRREIDGLRAIAVVPVILYHAGIPGLPAGYAGVDVFFVISGYLITSIIIDEIDRNQFSFLSFYERRLRRIAPALFFVCLACLPFAWLWMLPKELNDFGKSLYHAILSISNFLFWHDTRDYFAGSGDLKPLLHTWSLAIEEQFYLLFPFVLIVGRRARGRNLLLPVLSILVILSYSLTQFVPAVSPAANFYLLPTRFWELGLGAILALLMNDGYLKGMRYTGSYALLGMVLICGAYTCAFATKFYPGLQTVPVILGTVLIIAFSSAENLVGRFLGSRLLVVIGLGSYSLYLWHQPVFAFARIRSLGRLDGLDYALLIVVCTFMAFVTYRFVEQPFRRRGVVNRQRIIVFASAFGGLFLTLGLVTDKTDGFRGHFQDIVDVNAESFGIDKDCNGRILSKCQTSPEPEIVVWGDSFAMHLVDGILSSYPNVQLAQFNMSNCGPFIDLAPIPQNAGADWPQKCLDHNEQVFEFLAHHPSVKMIVVSSQFHNYVANRPVFRRHLGPADPSVNLVVSELRKTLDQLKLMGIKPLIFAPPPQDGTTDIGLCLARTKRWGVPSGDSCELIASKSIEFNRDIDRLLKAISQDYPVLNFTAYLCGNRATCTIKEGGVSIYQDGGHLSAAGSSYLGKKLDFYHAILKASSGGCVRQGDPYMICELRPLTDSSWPFRTPKWRQG